MTEQGSDALLGEAGDLDSLNNALNKQEAASAAEEARVAAVDPKDDPGEDYPEPDPPPPDDTGGFDPLPPDTPS